MAKGENHTEYKALLDIRTARIPNHLTSAEAEIGNMSHALSIHLVKQQPISCLHRSFFIPSQVLGVRLTVITKWHHISMMHIILISIRHTH